ncbi:MAG TPA: polyphosphate polymerase domain-containing protein [Halothiobacillaceae bacterium]|nr:polyphosphate polymerase domain-containing protein [Halothiobacillaceae bacterium]
MGTSPVPGNTVSEYTPLHTHRYERKFVVDTLTSHQVVSLVRLHPRLFYAPYPPRYVNNLYLDTADMEYYYDNVYGAASRRKVRVRWYGDLQSEIARPILEVKVKDGLVGTKRSYPMPGFSVAPDFSSSTVQRLFGGASLPYAVACEVRCLSVVLLNRYHRCYYASRDGAFRLTIDTDVTYYRANGALGNRLLHRQAGYREVIVELKYAVDQETAANRVVGYFPFRVTRNSKYVQGVERVYF